MTPRFVSLFLVPLMAAACLSPRPAQTQTSYLGVQNCSTSQCHQKPTRPGAPAAFPSWQKDPHSVAFAGGVSGKGDRSGLTGPKALAIGKKLGIADPTHEQKCLACHAGSVQPGGIAIPIRLPLRGPASLEDGVQCEGCHGPGAAWVDSHQRDRLGAVNQGMFDLLAPGAAGRQCLACHKVIDPKDIEAGHPDQSRFNFQKYADSVRHWDGHFNETGTEYEPVNP